MTRAGLDLVDVLFDPDFRTDGIPWRPRFAEVDRDGRTRPLPGGQTIGGVLFPATGDELVQKDDGDHAAGSLTLITEAPISAGDGGRGGDQIEWEGGVYTAVATKAWPYAAGFFEVTLHLAEINPTDGIEPRDAGALL